MSAALADYATGRGGEHAALAALSACRLLVPVVAVLTAEEEGGGPDGLRREKSSEMALPTLIGTDGRAALPAFTCLDSLTRWRADARPVPVPAAQVWKSGAQEASAVVIDVAGPVPFAVDGVRLAALAQGRPAPMPHEDPDVLALVRDALAAEPAIAGFWLLPGGHGTDMTLCLVPASTATGAQLQNAVERASATAMAGAGGRVRRGIEVALTEPGAGPADAGPAGAGPAGAGPADTGPGGAANGRNGDRAAGVI